MEKIAPNLSAVLGTGPAANMMGAAGGLIALSKMPSCNVQVLGARRKHLSGMSTAAAARAGDLHAGYVFSAEVVRSPARSPPISRCPMSVYSVVSVRPPSPCHVPSLCTQSGCSELSALIV